MAFNGFVFKISKLHVEGMALFPFILVKRTPGPVLLNHEKIHLRQQLELGIILFYCWYGVEYLFRLIRSGNHATAYYTISFEKEAFQHQDNLHYLATRRPFAFTRYL